MLTELAACAPCSVLAHRPIGAPYACPECGGALARGTAEVGFHDARRVYGEPGEPWIAPAARDERQRYACADGHRVRSREEKAIDDWLHARGILHEYEPKVKGMRPDREGRAKREAAAAAGPSREDGSRRAPRRAPSAMRPDWRVGNVYVEFWGLAGQRGYEARREEKLALYKERRLKLVELFPEDLDRLEAKLGALQPARIFF